MPVGHFLQTRTGRDLYEPVFNNLFEVSYQVPDLVTQQYPDINDPQAGTGLLLLENTTSISFGGIMQTLNTVKQNFKYSSRAFTGLPSDTTVQLDVEFNINHNEENSILVYNVMRAWYDLSWNSQTGLMHLKRNQVGRITANHHDKEGGILRRLIFFNCQMTKLDGGFDSLRWGSSDIASGKATFVADYWFDTYLDHSTI